MVPNPHNFQAYSQPCVTLAYAELWYNSKSWQIQNQRHIQNPTISRTLEHLEPETYSESWTIQNVRLFRTKGILRTLPNICDGAL